jgi:penicillin-insensitive murein endopeptidase
MGSRTIAAAAISLASVACVRAPSPLTPEVAGSVGVPHKGVLTDAAELPREGVGFRWLRDNDRHYALPRFVKTIERAAAKVARERPGSTLRVGDLSARHGGHVSGHSSHRTGRDADLLLYVETLEGAPTETTDFVHVGPDGLAWDEAGKRFVRLDVEREWLLVKALVEDPDARAQWLFVSVPVKALLVEWARARGEPSETILRAMDAMIQPGRPAQSHDDHIHLRTACEPAEIAAGCEPTGPDRPWFGAAPAPAPPSTTELLMAILQPRDGHGDDGDRDGKSVSGNAKATR